MKRTERKKIRLDVVKLHHEMSAAKTEMPRSRPPLPDKRAKNADRLSRSLARQIAGRFGEEI